MFNQRIDKFEIVGGVAHDQPTALRQKICARPGRERHALALEKFFRAFTIHELMSARGFLRIFARPARARCRSRGLIERRYANVHRAADESGQNTIFFRNEIGALLADRNDRDRVRLDLHFQTGLAGDVAQRFAERDLI